MSVYNSGGTICSVVTCKSNAKLKKKTGESISFHRFPKDPRLRKEWIIRCCRGGVFNPDNKRICSKHFCKEDFEDICRAKLMNVAPKKLKSTAIPCLNLTFEDSCPMKTTSSNSTSSRHQRAIRKQQKQIVSERMTKALMRQVSIVELSDVSGASTDELNQLDFENHETIELCQNEKHVCKYIQSHCDSLKAENKALKKELGNMKNENSKLLYKNKQLQISILHLQSDICL